MKATDIGFQGKTIYEVEEEFRGGGGSALSWFDTEEKAKAFADPYVKEYRHININEYKWDAENCEYLFVDGHQLKVEEKGMEVTVRFKNGTTRIYTKEDFVENFRGDDTLYCEDMTEEPMSGMDWALLLNTTKEAAEVFDGIELEEC